LLAYLSHAEAAGGSLDQARAETVFQLGDAATQLGFRLAKCATGGGKSAVSHDLDEEIEIVQILHSAISVT
jgi:hypothetical protein